MDDPRLRRLELHFRQQYGREMTTEERKFLLAAALILDGTAESQVSWAGSTQLEAG